MLASCDFTKQGQPCLSLSRSVFFRKCISEVAASKEGYGFAAAESLPPLAVAIHLPSAGALGSNAAPHSSGTTTTLEEGRVLLTASLLSRLLRSLGHTVKVTCPPSPVGGGVRGEKGESRTQTACDMLYWMLIHIIVYLTRRGASGPGLCIL